MNINELKANARMLSIRAGNVLSTEQIMDWAQKHANDLREICRSTGYKPENEDANKRFATAILSGRPY